MSVGTGERCRRVCELLPHFPTRPHITLLHTYPHPSTLSPTPTTSTLTPYTLPHLPHTSPHPRHLPHTPTHFPIPTPHFPNPAIFSPYLTQLLKLPKIPQFPHHPYATKFSILPHYLPILSHTPPYLLYH